MAGLNDTWLADDSLEAKQALPVEVFKERAPGTLPEISEYATIIAVEPPVDAEAESEDGIVEKTGEIASVAIEEYQVAMRDLQLFTDSITNAGGMSLSIAQESISLMPGFVNEDRPLGFFTKHPSKTQLSAALEAVEENRKGILAKMVEKIKAFFVALKQRMADFVDRFMGGDRKAKIAALEKQLERAGFQLMEQATIQKTQQNIIDHLDTEMKKLGERLVSESAQAGEKLAASQAQTAEANRKLTAEAAAHQRTRNELRNVQEKADAAENAPKYIGIYAKVFENSLKETMDGLTDAFKKHVAELPNESKKAYAYSTSDFVISSDTTISGILRAIDKDYAKIREVLTSIDFDSNPESYRKFNTAISSFKFSNERVEKLEEIANVDFSELSKITHIAQFLGECAYAVKSFNGSRQQDDADRQRLTKMAKELEETVKILEKETVELEHSADDNHQEAAQTLWAAIGAIQNSVLPLIKLYGRAIALRTKTAASLVFVKNDVLRFVTNYNAQALTSAHAKASDEVPASIARAVRGDATLQGIYKSFVSQTDGVVNKASE